MYMQSRLKGALPGTFTQAAWSKKNLLSGLYMGVSHLLAEMILQLLIPRGPITLSEDDNHRRKE